LMSCYVRFYYVIKYEKIKKNAYREQLFDIFLDKC
jgi:hypothetical protein